MDKNQELSVMVAALRWNQARVYRVSAVKAYKQSEAHCPLKIGSLALREEMEVARRRESRCKQRLIQACEQERAKSAAFEVIDV